MVPDFLKPTQTKDSFEALAATLPLSATLTSLAILIPAFTAVPIAYLLTGTLSSILVLPHFANLNRLDFPQDTLAQVRATKSGQAFLALCEGREIAVNCMQELLLLMET